ncbi:hypothetical protein Mapa_008180 [Marchantia paleacea]|nr:hypothetical protein Mapa_008180 [Marchantia paleacea]
MDIYIERETERDRTKRSPERSLEILRETEEHLEVLLSGYGDSRGKSYKSCIFDSRNDS